MSSQDKKLPNIQKKMQANIILFLAGKFVSLFGTFVYSFAMGLFVLKETGSGLSFATTLMFGTVPKIVLAPLAGVVADKVDRKSLVVIMDLLSGMVILGLFTAFYYAGFQLIYVYTATVLLSICNTFFAVAMEASIPNLVEDSYLMRINSMSNGISSITNIISPIIAGIVYGFVNIHFFLIINGLSFIVSGISEMFIDFKLNDRAGFRKAAIGKPSIMHEFKEGLSYLKGQKKIMTLFMAGLVINFLFSLGFNVPFPYLVNNVIGLSSAQYGLLNSFFPIGVLVASLLLSVFPEKEKKYPYIYYGLLVLSLGLVLMGLAGLPTLLQNVGTLSIFIYMLVLMFVSGFANPLVNTPIMVMLQREIPDEIRGRVLGLITTISQAITPIAFILSGLLLEKMPIYILMVIPGLISFLFALRLGRNKYIQTI